MLIAGFAAGVLSIFAAPNPAPEQEGQKGQIHVQRVCPSTGPDATFAGAPGSYCTITVSDLAEIPAKVARVYHDEPSRLPIGTVGFLDSKVVLYAGPGNWAVGRCTVDFSNGLGLCNVSDRCACRVQYPYRCPDRFFDWNYLLGRDIQLQSVATQIRRGVRSQVQGIGMRYRFRSTVVRKNA